MEIPSIELEPSDVIATIALVISLFSIWSQDKGVKKQLLVANIGEYTKRYQSIMWSLPESVLYSNFDISSLDRAERIKILRYMWLYFDLCFEEYSLYHNLKLIDKKLWKIWESAIIASFSRPAFSQCWVIISQQTSYGSGFEKFINSIINSQYNGLKKL